MHIKIKPGVVAKYTIPFLLLLFPISALADISILAGTGIKDTNRGAFQVSTNLTSLPKIRLHYTRLSDTNVVSAAYDLKYKKFDFSGGGAYMEKVNGNLPHHLNAYIEVEFSITKLFRCQFVHLSSYGDDNSENAVLCGVRLHINQRQSERSEKAKQEE